MGNIINKFEKDSVTMNAGSSMNGDIHIYGQQAKTSDIDSPLHLSERNGTKIDFIRMMNAWYECGKVVDGNGAKPTKKEFFTWVGKIFNIDLSHYDKDLSNSMASSVAFEKQSRIFEELKAKHEEIYNSK